MFNPAENFVLMQCELDAVFNGYVDTRIIERFDDYANARILKYIRQDRYYKATNRLCAAALVLCAIALLYNVW